MRILAVKIGCIIFLVCSANFGLAQSKYSETIKEVKTLLADSPLSKNYHGAVLIADGEAILYEEAFGNNMENQANTTETKFGLASMGKMFTATATFQLVEKGKLSLDQTIGELLEDYPNEGAKGITVKHLLTHTSGMGDYFGPAFFEKKEEIKSLSDFLPFFVNDPINFTPGEQMRYSNAGYIVLGLIIEELSGTDYNSYVNENILKPSGMVNTGPLEGSAGGGPSTVRDLHKFAQALQNHKLINGESFASMITDQFGFEYGFGMTLRKLNNFQLYGHNGGAPGVAGELNMVMDGGLILVSMSNRSPLEGWAQLRTSLQKAFFGVTPEMEKFLNTEAVIQTYKEEGFASASQKLKALNNNIIDKNTFHYAEHYANSGAIEKALEVMQLIVQAYSKEWYPYAFLADFQVQAGLKEEAVRNYKKSLEINPENPEVLSRLAQLQKEGN